MFSYYEVNIGANVVNYKCLSQPQHHVATHHRDILINHHCHSLPTRQSHLVGFMCSYLMHIIIIPSIVSVDFCFYCW